MRSLSRLVLMCSSVLVFVGPVWGAKPSDVEDALNNAPTGAPAPTGTVTKTESERPGKSVKSTIPAARSAGRAAPAAATAGSSAAKAERRRYSAAERKDVERQLIVRRILATGDKKLLKKMGTAYAHSGPKYFDDQKNIDALQRDLERTNSDAARLYREADPELTGPVAEASEEFFGTYGEPILTSGKPSEPDDDPYAGDERGPGYKGAGQCATCAAVTGEVNALRDSNRELKEKVALLQAQIAHPPVVPVAVPAERNLTGNAIGFNIPLGPLMAFLINGRGQQNRGGFIPPPGYRMPYGYAGGRGIPGPGRGYGGFAGGGPGFGPGGRQAPNVIPGAGGFAGGNQFGNGLAGGYGGGGYGGGYGGGAPIFGGQAGAPAYYPGQNWNSGGGIIYNRSASAASPLSIPGLTNSSLMNNSLNAPLVIPGGGGFA